MWFALSPDPDFEDFAESPAHSPDYTEENASFS